MPPFFARRVLSRGTFSRAAARGAYVLFLSARKKKYEKERLTVCTYSAIPCRCCCGKPQQVDISPRSFADKAVSTRHSANNAALRQIYFVQTRSSDTHRVPIMAKFYLIWHAFQLWFELDGSLPIFAGKFCGAKFRNQRSGATTFQARAKYVCFRLYLHCASPAALERSASFRPFLSDKEKDIEPCADAARKRAARKRAARERTRREKKRLFLQKQEKCIEFRITKW